METLHSRQVTISKDSIEVTKSTYCKYSHSFKRNTFHVRWTTRWEGEFGRGYTRKASIKDVQGKVFRKRLQVN